MPFRMRDENTPLHLDSLGPCPTTVAEWVEQSERTGILEFPLLLAIAENSYKRGEGDLIPTPETSQPDVLARYDAVCQTQDQEFLASVLCRDPSGFVRCEAVKRVEDQSLLARVATRDPSDFVQVAAVTAMTDQKLLSRFAMFHPSAYVRHAAVKRLEEAGVNVTLHRGGTTAPETQEALNKRRDDDTNPG